MSLFNRVPAQPDDPEAMPPTGIPRSTAGPVGLQRALDVANPNALPKLQANVAKMGPAPTGMLSHIAGSLGGGGMWLQQLLETLRSQQPDPSYDPLKPMSFGEQPPPGSNALAGQALRAVMGAR